MSAPLGRGVPAPQSLGFGRVQKWARVGLWDGSEMISRPTCRLMISFMLVEGIEGKRFTYR